MPPKLPSRLYPILIHSSLTPNARCPVPPLFSKPNARLRAFSVSIPLTTSALPDTSRSSSSSQSEHELSERFDSLRPKGWILSDDGNNERCITKDYKFRNFKEAWTFMNLVAEKAEEKRHHPEWWNVSLYVKMVSLFLFTKCCFFIPCRGFHVPSAI